MTRDNSAPTEENFTSYRRTEDTQDNLTKLTLIGSTQVFVCHRLAMQCNVCVPYFSLTSGQKQSQYTTKSGFSLELPTCWLSIFLGSNRHSNRPLIISKVAAMAVNKG